MTFTTNIQKFLDSILKITGVEGQPRPKIEIYFQQESLSCNFNVCLSDVVPQQTHVYKGSHLYHCF